MKVLVYDTETTGLPNWSVPSSDPSQPHVTQIAAELFDDETGKTHSFIDCLIYPAGWEISQEIETLTGISTKRCYAGGAAIHNALPLFIDLWMRCEVRVAHNESFDMRMLRIELMRHGMFKDMIFGDQTFPDHWKAGNAYCTLRESRKVIGGKMPTLREAYNALTGKTMEESHNAKADVAACKAVYLALKAMGA